jgi:hypothetical protein
LYWQYIFDYLKRWCDFMTITMEVGAINVEAKRLKNRLELGQAQLKG